MLVWGKDQQQKWLEYIPLKNLCKNIENHLINFEKTLLNLLVNYPATYLVISLIKSVNICANQSINRRGGLKPLRKEIDRRIEYAAHIRYEPRLQTHAQTEGTPSSHR